MKKKDHDLHSFLFHISSLEGIYIYIYRYIEKKKPLSTFPIKDYRKNYIFITFVDRKSYKKNFFAFFIKYLWLLWDPTPVQA